MRRFNHITALHHLLNLDTTLFKEELYYPWYIQTHAIKLISAIGLAIAGGAGLMLAVTTRLDPFSVALPMILITLLLGVLYYATVKQLRKSARNQAVSQMMKLEKKEFMRHLEPFVPDDQKQIAQRIITHLDFSPRQYISVTVATQNRILHNPDAFIKDIERMFEEKKLSLMAFDDTAFSDTQFAVPPKAKANYKKLQQFSTFNDEFKVPEAAKAAIMEKMKELANRAALGRHH